MSIQATKTPLGIPALCCVIIDFLPRKDQNCSKRVCHAFQHAAETVQEKRASVGQKFFLRNRSVCHATLGFVSIQDQESCKQVNRAWKRNTNDSQRQRILKMMPPDWTLALGKERLQNAPIRNWEAGAYIRNRDLPASFVIGFWGDFVYAAVRTKTYVPSRCCPSRLSLNFDLGHKNRIATYGLDIFFNDSVVDISQLLRGERLFLEIPETPSRCCSLGRVASCFKRLFFESDRDMYHAEIKLD